MPPFPWIMALGKQKSKYYSYTIYCLGRAKAIQAKYNEKLVDEVEKEV